jgi:SAM-dependent methyltransferase
VKDWTRYYDAAGEDPRATLLDAVGRFDEPGFAVDLGCGTGRDTFELLRRGWRVRAIDSHEEAVRRVRAAAGDEAGLETQVAAFEDAALPPCDLVNASFALPFCPPERFDDLWARIGEALRCGGRLSGQLFGDRDGWSGEPGITFHTRADIDRLLAAFDAERLDEEEEDSTTVVGDAKHWHLFHIVARKR